MPEPLPGMWESKKTRVGLVLQPVGDGVDAWLAVDTTTGEPRLASTSDRAAWNAALAGGTYGTYSSAELLAILGAPPEAQPGSGGQCFAGLDGEAAGIAFAEALLAARFRAATSAPCLDRVPEQFTGIAGACWDECTPRTFPRDGVTIGEGLTSASDSYRSVSLPMTYLNVPTAWHHIDVIEHWQLRPEGDGWAATLSSIEPPLTTRAASLDAVNTYLAALAAEDWNTAAGFHFDDGINPDERADLHQLAPENLTVEGVAAALAQWCSAECDTTAATPDDPVVRRWLRVGT